MKNINWYKKFNEFLKQQGISKDGASVKSGIPYSTMCAYLNGKRTPSEKNKEVIFNTLGFDIYKAMYGEHND